MPIARRPRRRFAGAALLAAATTATVTLSALPSAATSIPERTLRISAATGGKAANGTSSGAVVSQNGRVVAFESEAGNLSPLATGGTRNVYVYNRDSRRMLLASVGIGNKTANGPSSDPALTRPGDTVAFASKASNLVEGDTNAKSDIFLRRDVDPIQRVSVATDGTEANGDSTEPAVSGDGRLVVFTSTATNLAPGNAKGLPQIFLRDLKTGTTLLVSRAYDRGPANGPSTTPSISAGGRYVTFESQADNLVHGDTNGIADVFLYDVVTGHIERVSVSSRGKQQNHAVTVPFKQISAASDNGRYVVFDSDADNLVEGDTNRHTDVFLRDRKLRTTTRLSLTAAGVQGDNDSFAPSITPNGRYVAFESFAGNLAPGSAPRENVYVYDRSRRAPVLVSVTSSGAPRGPEVVSQLLQRPSLSQNARVVAFSSTAMNLAPGDTGGYEQVYVRRMDPPQGRIVSAPPKRIGPRGAVVVLGADDPTADRFLCRIDSGPQFDCGASFRIPTLPSGGHVLRVYAGGPGMLFDPHSMRARFTVTRKAPTVRIAGRSGGYVTGTATDRSGAGIEAVYVALAGPTRSAVRCRWYDGKRFKAGSCFEPVYIKAEGRARWRYRLPKSRWRLVAFARAVDRAGNASAAVHD
jgi:Tol biopolymer transport system component